VIFFFSKKREAIFVFVFLFFPTFQSVDSSLYFIFSKNKQPPVKMGSAGLFSFSLPVTNFLCVSMMILKDHSGQ